MKKIQSTNRLKVQFSSPPEWDDIVKKEINFAGFCQSSSWGRIQNRFNNKKSIYFSNDVSEESLGYLGAQCFISEVKDTSGLRSFLRNSGFLASSTLEISDGPIIQTSIPEEEVGLFSQFIMAVETFCLENKIDWIKSPGFNHKNPYACSQQLQSSLIEKGYTVRQWGTFLIDLSPTKEIIYKKLDHHVRARIRKAEENQISIHQPETKEEYLEKFVHIFNSLQILNGRPKRPEESFLGFWEERDSIFYHPFYATAQDGEIIGVLGSYHCNGVTTEITSALHPRCLEEKLPAQDLLHWHQILTAKNDGAATFDLAGVNPNPKDSKEIGIRNFKSKWGGQYLEFFRYEKCLNSRYLFLKKVINTIRPENTQVNDKA